VPAIDGVEPDLVAISKSSGYINPDDDIPSELQNHRALRSLGWLRHATLDLSLRSCDYQLADKPAASEIARRATFSMIAGGILTQRRLDAGGTTFQLSEDPTNPEHLFFTVLLIKLPGEPNTGPSLSGEFNTYAATIDKATGQVLNAGLAHW